MKGLVERIPIFSKTNPHNYKAFYYLEDYNTGILCAVSRYNLNKKKLVLFILVLEEFLQNKNRRNLFVYCLTFLNKDFIYMGTSITDAQKSLLRSLRQLKEYVCLPACR